MQVTIVTETYPPDVNGVALTVHGLERRLRTFGHDVKIIRPRRKGEADDNNKGLMPSVGLPRYPGLRLGLPGFFCLRRNWKIHRPDVLYVATEGPLGASAVWAARSLGIPVATGYHTRFDHYMSRYGLGWLTRPASAWLRALHNRGDVTVVPTSALACELKAKHYRNVRCLPRAVDIARFDPVWRDAQLRRRWGASERSPVLLYVGRIAPEKNLAVAIRAFYDILQTQPDVRMVLVGDGPSRPTLQAAHPELIFAGMQQDDDLSRHYASADIFLFPSVTETFGNVTLEAMASGLATVAFDDGAAHEHIRDGLNGRLARVGDTDTFIAAALALARNGEQSRTLGEMGRLSMRELDPVSVARAFERLLVDLVNRSPRTDLQPSGESIP